MHISAVEEYGLRCALQLASLEKGTTIAASQIAEREGLSMQYASKIMHLFRKAGLVKSVRGIQGGFCLSKEADKIAIKEVFAALKEEKEEATGFCTQYKGQQQNCVHLQSCGVRPVWEILNSYFDNVLENISLADISRGEGESRRRIETLAKFEAERIQQRFSKGTENERIRN